MADQRFHTWDEYFLSVVKRAVQERPLHVPFRFDGLGGRHLAVARIATDLSELLKGKVRADTRIRIVGFDGFSLCVRDYPWRRSLAEWLTTGATIRYLLQQPLAETASAVEDIRAQVSPQSPGTLTLRKAAPDAPSGFADQWRTFHFVILENPSILWIETRHPHGQTEALDCYFFDEDLAPDVPGGRALAAQFDRVFEHESSPYLEA